MLEALRARARATTWVGTVDRLAPGLYAWVVTVGLPLAHRDVALGSRLWALLAVVALTSGALLSAWASTTARLLGIWVFVGSCLAAWAAQPSAISGSHLDPVQGALGSLGWSLYVLSWSGDHQRVSGVGRADIAPSLPRASRGHASVALACAAVGAALPMVVAWWVPGVERALFAHGVALAIAIGTLVAVTRLMEAQGAPRASGPSSAVARLAPAVTTLLALSVLLLTGAALTWLR